jgi:hypothetical protein
LPWQICHGKSRKNLAMAILICHGKLCAMAKCRYAMAKHTLPWQNAEMPWQNTLCHGKCKLSMHFYKKVLKIEKQNILTFKPLSKYDNLR